MKPFLGVSTVLVVFFVSLSYPFAKASDFQSSISISSSGRVVLTGRQGEIYWKGDAEEGNFYDWRDAGIGYGGSAQFDLPDSKVKIVTRRVFKGTYAVKCKVMNAGGEQPNSNRAQVRRREPMQNLEEAYYGAALYLSPNFGGGSHQIIMGFKHVDPAKGNFCNLQVDGRGYLRIQRKHDPDAEGPDRIQTLWRDEVPAPVGKWFTAVFYLRATKDGKIKCWKNGVLVFRINGDFRSMESQAPGPNFYAGLYEDPAITKDQYVLVDEMICASTYQLALPRRG